MSQKRSSDYFLRWICGKGKANQHGHVIFFCKFDMEDVAIHILYVLGLFNIMMILGLTLRGSVRPLLQINVWRTSAHLYETDKLPNRTLLKKYLPLGGESALGLGRSRLVPRASDQNIVIQITSDNVPGSQGEIILVQ